MADDSKYLQSDPYEQENGVLKNNLAITTTRELNVAESDHASWRVIQLQARPIRGQFDLKHLQQIHKYVFQDVYPWAGEIRRVNIGKGDTNFCRTDRIEPEFDKLHKQLSGENRLRGLPADEFAKQATQYLVEINAIHPFREGNGRTQREFIGQIAKEAGYKIEWNKMGREAVTQAHIDAHSGEDRKLQRLIELNLKVMTPAERMAHAFRAHEEPEARREYPALAGAYNAVRAVDRNLEFQGIGAAARERACSAMSERIALNIEAVGAFIKPSPAKEPGPPQDPSQEPVR